MPGLTSEEVLAWDVRATVHSGGRTITMLKGPGSLWAWSDGARVYLTEVEPTWLAGVVKGFDIIASPERFQEH